MQNAAYGFSIEGPTVQRCCIIFNLCIQTALLFAHQLAEH